MGKPSKPKQDTTPETVGVPLTATKADKRLLEALKADVAPEATPALQFITEHARTISLIVVGIVLAAIIGMVYQWHHKSSLEDARAEVSAALGAGQPEQVISALEALVPGLPAELQVGAYSEIVLRAENLGYFEKAAEYWRKIYEQSADPGLKTVAGLGLAKNLIALQREEEGGALLDKLAEEASAAMLPQVQMEQAILAERRGDLQKAIDIYKALEVTNNFYSDTFLAYQIEQLSRRLTDAESAE